MSLSLFIFDDLFFFDFETNIFWSELELSSKF